MGLDDFKNSSNSESSSKSKSHKGYHENRTDDKRYRDKQWMKQKYEEECKSLQEIADIVDSAYSTISKWANKHGIDTRGSQESKYPTKQDVIDGLKHVAKEAGKDFTARDVEDIETSALVNQCKQQFGTFNKAKKQVSSEIYTSDNEKGQIPVDESSNEFAYVVGVVISDGWLSNNRIGLDVNDEVFAKEFIEALSNLSGRDDLSVSQRKKTHGGEKVEQYRAAVMWKKLFNKLDEEYKIEDWNKWIVKLNNEQLKYYVQGVYESEGSVMESGYRIGVMDSNHASSYLYAVSEALNVQQQELTYRVSYSSSGFAGDSIVTYVYIPAEYRSMFKQEINPAIKCGPEKW
jgi:hypothetical protein